MSRSGSSGCSHGSGCRSMRVLHPHVGSHLCVGAQLFCYAAPLVVALGISCLLSVGILIFSGGASALSERGELIYSVTFVYDVPFRAVC